jgi:hypothetical protein
MPKPLIVGDSIGVLLQQHSDGFDSDAVVGRSPTQILRAIRNIATKTPDALRGRDVILSTGASNNTQDVALAREQIKVLKQAGARVVMVGVGNRQDFVAADINKNLAQIAQDEHVVFTGALDPATLRRDHVHPTKEGATALMAKVMQKFNEAPVHIPPAEKRAGQHRHFDQMKLIEAQRVVAGIATVAEIKDVQKALRDDGYDLGKFGANKDGVDGIAAKFTRRAITKAIKDSHTPPSS